MKKILIVDDEEIMRDMLILFLTISLPAMTRKTMHPMAF
jgi:YesN/AraC family two-component response regulator